MLYMIRFTDDGYIYFKLYNRILFNILFKYITLFNYYLYFILLVICITHSRTLTTCIVYDDD